MKARSLIGLGGKLLIIPFGFCVLFLRVLGMLLGLNYKQISVVFNLYLQGGLLCLAGVSPLFIAAYNCICHFSFVSFGLFLAFVFYAIIWVCGFVWLLRRYKLPCDSAFDLCVADLKLLGTCWGMSYYAINLLIFVVGWLSLFIINFLLAFGLFVVEGSTVLRF